MALAGTPPDRQAMHFGDLDHVARPGAESLFVDGVV
jgi:hypothetical protein